MMVRSTGVGLNADSLERLIPAELRAGDATGQETLKLHVERYEFAARLLAPGRVLDCACGVGYGTRILADRATSEVSAVGVDLSPAAIDYAREHYAGPRVRFVESDAMEFSDSEGFDTIVSIETIEHLPDPVSFVDRMIAALRPGGVFVASVPVTPSVDANPHHLHDFTERSFQRLFARHDLLEITRLTQDQPFALGAVVTRSEARMQQVRRNLPAYYLSHPTHLFRRLASTLRHGFKNRYLTVAWRSPA
jgi:SAM-dependent methyltransferase